MWSYSLGSTQEEGVWGGVYDNGDVYVGERKDGKKHGRGTYKFKDGRKYEGEWKDDRKHGRGTFRYVDGGKYEGEWKDDRKHGRGTFRYMDGNKYEGEWKDDKKNGRGTQECPDGNKWDGEWKDGKMHGRGTLEYPDGRKYDGEWTDGNAHGRGTYKFKDGRKYEGEWKDNRKHGRGTFRYVDGRKYEGEWKDGKMHGRGTHEYPDGSMYEGEWKMGLEDGNGTKKYTNGDVYVGVFKEGKRTGQGKCTYADGGSYEGEWNMGTYEGDGTLEMPEGGVYRGTFLLGYLEGEGTWTGADGSVYEGCFRGGKRHGWGKLEQREWVYEGGWHEDKLCGQCKVHMPGEVAQAMWFFESRSTTLENLVRMYVTTWGRGKRVSTKMPEILMKEKEFVLAAMSQKLTDGFVARIHGDLRQDPDVLVAVAGAGERALETIGRGTVRHCVLEPDGGALMGRIVRRNADMWWYLRRLVVNSTERTNELEAMEADAHVPYHRRSGRRYRSCDAWAAYSRLDVATVMGVTPEQAPGRVLLPNDLLIKIGQLIDGVMVSRQWHGEWAAPCVHRGKRQRV